MSMCGQAGVPGLPGCVPAFTWAGEAAAETLELLDSVSPPRSKCSLPASALRVSQPRGEK